MRKFLEKVIEAIEAYLYRTRPMMTCSKCGTKTDLFTGSGMCLPCSLGRN